jgi:ABC-type transport system involved in multi-copper enzyme maturation permease subunit
VAAVNPAALLFGPIFQKEVQTAGRKRGWYIGRGVYALLLLVAVGLVFWAMWSSLRHDSSRVMRLQQMQELAPSLALTVIWFQFVVLALIGPNLTAPAITDEKRAGTLAALLTTPMTAAEIVGGKLSGRLVHVIVLALLSAPALLAARVFGGLSPGVVVQATCVSISTAALGTALGLMFSVWSKRSTGAGVFGLLTLALAQGAIPAFDGLLYQWFHDDGYQFHQWTLAASSPVTLGFVTRDAVMGLDAARVSIELTSGTATSSGWILDLGPMWLVNTLYTLVLAAGVAAFTSVALRRTMQKEGATGPTAPKASSRGKKGKARAKANGAPAAGAPIGTEEPAREEVLGKERVVGDNPVLWREVRQPTFGSRRRLLLVAALAGIGLLLLYAKMGIADEGVHGTVAIVAAIAVMLQSVFMTTGAFVGEREGRTLEVLLTTPLSAGEIIIGKLLGALRAQWFLPAVAMADFGIAWLAGVMHPVMLLHMALIFTGPVLLFTATGLMMSLMLKKSTPASVCNLGLALLFWLAPWLVLALLEFVADRSVSSTNGRWWLDRSADCLTAFNPVAMAVSAYEPAMHPGWRASRLTYELASASEVSMAHFTMAAAGVFVVEALLAAVVLWAALLAFKRFTGRTS